MCHFANFAGLLAKYSGYLNHSLGDSCVTGGVSLRDHLKNGCCEGAQLDN